MKDKSDENWRVGETCLANGDVNAAASRLYYGLLQAVLLYAILKRKYEQPEDGRVHGDLMRRVRQEGEQRKYYDTLSSFHRWRVTADYQQDSPPRETIQTSLAEGARMREFYLRKAEV